MVDQLWGPVEMQEETHLITIDLGGNQTEFIKSRDQKGVEKMLKLRNSHWITYVPMINVMVSTEGVNLARTQMVIQKIKENIEKIPDGYLRVGTLRVCEARPDFLAKTEKRYNQENFRSSSSYEPRQGWNPSEVDPDKWAGFLQDYDGEMPMRDGHVDRFMNYAAIVCDMLRIRVDRVVIPQQNGYNPRVFSFDKPDRNYPAKDWTNKLQLIRDESIEYSRRLKEVEDAHEIAYAETRREYKRKHEETIKMIEARRREAEETYSRWTSSVHQTLLLNQEPVREEYRARWMRRVLQDEEREQEMAQKAEYSTGAACVLL